MPRRSPQTQTVMLTLRIPASLRTALRRGAKIQHRSVNGQVVALLWKAVESDAAQSAR